MLLAVAFFLNSFLILEQFILCNEVIAQYFIDFYCFALHYIEQKINILCYLNISKYYNFEYTINTKLILLFYYLIIFLFIRGRIFNFNHLVTVAYYLIIKKNERKVLFCPVSYSKYNQKYIAIRQDEELIKKIEKVLNCMKLKDSYFSIKYFNYNFKFVSDLSVENKYKVK